MTTVTRTLDIFRAELGTREEPTGSNHQKYGVWYGFDRVPWCAIFVSWGLAQAGLGAQYRFAAVASSVASSKRAGTWRTGPQVGDVACKLYTATSGHTGIVEAVNGDGTITTIEGNTSGVSDANGGMVMRRRRSAGFWNAGYIRIAYTAAQPVLPVDGADISHHQGDLAVAAIAASGVHYLWHKATEGASFVDGQYAAKQAQAEAIGLPFGAYDFVRPTVDPVVHAHHFHHHAGHHGPGMLRPAMDIEVPGVTASWLRTYRDEVERLFGVTPVAYVATSIYQQAGIPQALAGCPLWVPRYNTSPPVIPWDVWQHTDRRPPFGIDGNVTHNLSRVLLGSTTTPEEDPDVTPADRALLDQLHAERNVPKLNARVVGIAVTPSGNGYWEAAADGGVFNYGDAQHFGALPEHLAPGQKLNNPVVGIAATPTGQGYWLVAGDGGIFAFGDAEPLGSPA